MDVSAVEVAPDSRSERLARGATLALFGAAIFAGATLVFLVQPMAARMVLPLFGGSQAVWTTSMLFFQGVLLAGYGYAHVSTRLLGPRRQPLVHVLVLLLPLAALPIGGGLAPPPADAPPSLWLLGVLALAVGAPFFVVTTASPLLQRWLATSGHASGRDPYFLYALGNAGSLLALLGYPLLVEPWLTLDEQARLWSLGYVLFAALALGCVIAVRRGTGEHERERTRAVAAPIPWPTRLRWVATALVPSSLMLGATTHIATDVASAPLLWVLPLATYLLTFIVAFARRPPVTPALAARLLPVPVCAALLTLLGVLALPVPLMVLLHLVTLFLAGTLAHGRLAEERPAAERLTEFYFLLSLGGVLGGALNALVAPLVFDSVLEYPLVLALALLLRPGRGRERFLALAFVPLAACLVGLAASGDSLGLARLVLGASVVLLLLVGRGRPRRLALGFGSLGALLVLAGASVHAERTFFGVLRVVDQEGERRLYHGTTLHGIQRADGEPLSYFTREGPLGDVMAAYGDRLRRVDVIGLGVGTLAAYGRPGQQLTFYELDPAVADVAADPRYFTFLRDSRAHVAVVVGDGRQRLAEAPDGASDLVVVDAFSSDSIPVHLLTHEALALYLQKLRPEGVVAFHVTNRHLELAPVVAQLARHLGLAALERRDTVAGLLENGRAPSRWVAVARTPALLEPLRRRGDWQVPEPRGRVWTDDYSNLLAVLKWR